LTNIKYLQTFLKKFAIKNDETITSYSKLYNLFLEEFGEIKLNFDSLYPNKEKKI
jgi:hypothetical protein